MLVYGVVVAVLTVGGALAWIALLLWAARADGRDQRAYDSALRRYRAAESKRAAKPPAISVGPAGRLFHRRALRGRRMRDK
jgi:hypothetical protein